jgi:hypothetical protein
MLDAIYGLSGAEISKSEHPDMVCAMRSSENVDEDNVEEWIQSDACELGFQNMTHTHAVNAATKQEREEEDGDDESDEGYSMKMTVIWVVAPYRLV